MASPVAFAPVSVRRVPLSRMKYLSPVPKSPPLSAGRALGAHDRRRLDCGDREVGRLVRARAGADVQHRPRVTQRRADALCQARVFAAHGRVADAERVVAWRDATIVLSYTAPQWP